MPMGWKRVLIFGAAGFYAFVAVAATSLTSYLRNPAEGVSLSARAAEWGRDHYLGALVTWAEKIQYDLNPPRRGGRPATGAFGHGAITPVASTTGHLPLPATILSPAGSNLPGEGVWHVFGRRTTTGVPTTYAAYVRPDPVHTSYVTGVVWMDSTLLRASLYSGSQIPGPSPNGNPYPLSAPITGAASTTLVDAFNSGFRMDAARGGYYINGETVAPLRNGAASMVFTKEGRLQIGKWGRDYAMGPKVYAVRQNLDLIVDGGHVVRGLNSSDNIVWGATLGGGAFVWRSGVGVTANGAIVYAAGPALSITSLAQVLAAAGAVRAMELDINPDWVQFSAYAAKDGAVIGGSLGTSLLDGTNGTAAMAGTPSRYFTTWWARDFVTMSLR
jgi:hypothetical protein